MADTGLARNVLSLFRNLLLAATLYAIIYSLIHFLETGSINPITRPEALPSQALSPPSSGTKLTFGGHNPKINLNPHANWFNRPESLVIAKDDYLGRRPHVDTVANLPLLVEACRGSLEGLEKMRNVFDCMSYLANSEEEYYYLPEPSLRASSQDPKKAEYANADGHGNTLERYDIPVTALAASKQSLGTCAGPIIPYHMYWTGPATWRVEIFIKSYLYTQNLPCSRLWLWLDCDRNKQAVDDMLHRDPLFKRFLPLVERGDIKLKEWRFPSRIPLPRDVDNTDGLGYYKNPGKPNLKGEITVGDGVVRDANGQEWLALTQKQMTFLPVAVSDAFRFVALHLHGGVYCDTDILMLRDMRPLLLPDPKTGQHSFAERWAAHAHEGDYNTAVMSLTANSSLSSYLLRGGVRMGLNFHPRVIGRMAWKDGRNQEFLMLETAAFDPIWTEFNWDREGRCTVPCIRDYGVAFKGRVDSIRDEWESYDGPRLKEIDITHHQRAGAPASLVERHGTLENRLRRRGETQRRRKRTVAAGAERVRNDQHEPKPEPAEESNSFSTTSQEIDELRKAGLIADYIIDEDHYPPNNRTLENFFRGSWSYHIHNQWTKHPEPSSWFDVIEHAQDGFFRGERSNPYGEYWRGPLVEPYGRWPEFA
ncbi:hypothetical protein FGG08_000716 [Glutinoglossum americanum]|uniref:Snorna binding protein n=1 Tax=Glutinoglossum americanum TaxID=1670608 RepID=A0A9P8L6R1_9PEZI|nr:hypothetical protein FGG08_000716 [Glutinoglossum americanum]